MTSDEVFHPFFVLIVSIYEYGTAATQVTKNVKSDRWVWFQVDKVFQVDKLSTWTWYYAFELLALSPFNMDYNHYENHIQFHKRLILPE